MKLLQQVFIFAGFRGHISINYIRFHLSIMTVIQATLAQTSCVIMSVITINSFNVLYNHIPLELKLVKLDQSKNFKSEILC